MQIGFNGSCLKGGAVRGWARYTSCLISSLKDNYPEHAVFVFSNPDINHSVWEQVRLPFELRQNHISIFHGPANGGLPLFAPCPTVLTIHDLFAEEMAARQPTREKFTKSFLRYKADWLISVKRADLIITISEYCKRQLIDYGLAGEKIRVVYEGASPVFHPRKTKYAHPRPFFIYVGGFDERKKVDELLDLFVHSKLEADLLLVGTLGHDGKALKEVFGRDPRLVFTGFLPDDDLAEAYSTAQAFVTMSHAEGFGLPLVEAMACGCPVLARNQSALPEILGEGGVRIEPSTLIKEMERLLNDPAWRANLQNLALRRSLDFSWNETARKTMAVYEELAL